MSGKHSAKSSKMPVIIITAVIVVIAAIVCVLIFINPFGNKETHQNTTTADISSTAAEQQISTEPSTVSENSENTTVESSASEDPTENSSPAETTVDNKDIVVPTVSGETQGDKFSAEFTPYLAKNSNSDEEYSLKDVFGTAYDGGGFSFDSNGTFTDNTTSYSVNSGAYIVEGNNIVVTYSNDKNLIIKVSEWNGNVPAEIIINYGGIDVYFK